MEGKLMKNNIAKNSSSRLLVFVLAIVMMLHSCLISAFAATTDEEAPRLIDGEIYYIKNKNSGQYLMVSGSGTSASNKTNVIQTRDRSSAEVNGRQKWRLDYMGNGEYRIVSMLSTEETMYVLDVFANDNTNGSNIDVYSDANASDRRWKIALNSDNCSYRILSKCSNYTKAVGVADASCTNAANVAQYQYNTNSECEWIFEPVYNYSPALGINYARTNYDSYFPTFPAFDEWGSDCTNFASQCMLAGGVHFQDQWWIFKNNNSYLHPESSSQFNNSWDVDTIGGFLGIGASSPWISASKFCDFWSARVSYSDYTGEYIASNPGVVYSQPYYRGDVISMMTSGEAYHTVYISGYGTYDGHNTFMLTYHSTNTDYKSLLEIAENNPDVVFRFYKIN